MTSPRLLLALFLLALTARGALADRGTPVEDAATRAARRHFDRGEKLYALTRFSAALDEYQKAFDARPIPDFLFNIGQCYRNLGDYDAAIFSYRKYLTLAPDAANRAQVEQLIGDLQARKDQRDTQRLGLSHRAGRTEPDRTSGSNHEDDTERSEPAPIYKRWWFWTSVAVLGAAGSVGIYETTRPSGPPGTSLGNIVFGK